MFGFVSLGKRGNDFADGFDIGHYNFLSVPTPDYYLPLLYVPGFRKKDMQAVFVTSHKYQILFPDYLKLFDMPDRLTIIIAIKSNVIFYI
jgi:hypothetical protein